MFVLVSEYVGSSVRRDELLDAHHDWAHRYYESGHFLVGGPRVPAVGGVGVLRARSRAEVERILAEDPWNAAEVIAYQIIEFDESPAPNRHPAATAFLTSPWTCSPKGSSG
jgi:uncharacterized protein YciI